MEAMVKARRLKIQDIVSDPSLTAHVITSTELSLIDRDGRSFLNVNTPSDLETARQLMESERDASSGL